MDDMTEKWANVKGYPNYQVSDRGRIKGGRFKGRVIAVQKKKNGYIHTWLYKDAIGKNALIHRLMAEAFIPNPENKPQVNHKDGNKLNNTLQNLEWATRSENMSHAHRSGLIDCKGERGHSAKLTEIDVHRIRQRPWEGQVSLAKELGVDRHTIMDVRNYKSWNNI